MAIEEGTEGLGSIGQADEGEIARGVGSGDAGGFGDDRGTVEGFTVAADVSGDAPSGGCSNADDGFHGGSAAASVTDNALHDEFADCGKGAGQGMGVFRDGFIARVPTVGEVIEVGIGRSHLKRDWCPRRDVGIGHVEGGCRGTVVREGAELEIHVEGGRRGIGPGEGGDVELEERIGERPAGAQETVAGAGARVWGRIEEEGGAVGVVGPADAKGGGGDWGVGVAIAELEPVVGAGVAGDADGARA